MSLGVPQSTADRLVQVLSLLGFGIVAVVHAHQDLRALIRQPVRVRVQR